VGNGGAILVHTVLVHIMKENREFRQKNRNFFAEAYFTRRFPVA
jgi:hypothetical protein